MRAILFITSALLASAPAAAGVRVAVPPFAGPPEAATATRAAVVAALGGHDAVALDEITQAATLSSVDPTDPRSAPSLATLTGANAFVVGRVTATGDGYALTLLARALESDEPASAAIVSLAAPQPSAAERAEIRRFAAEALGGDDLSDDEVGGDDDDDGGDRTGLERRAAGAGEPGPVAIRAAVGVAATARRLSFSGGDPSMAPGMDGAPSPGLRVDVEAATRTSPSLAIAGAYERALGARVRAADGFQLPASQSSWVLEARARLRWRRLEVVGAIGTGATGYRLEVRPGGVTLPDARYQYASAGGDLCLRLDDAALSAGGRYLLPLAVSGITAPETFGGARAGGLEARAGFELETSERVALRLSLRYARFALAFDGTGQMSGGGIDGAVDIFAGGDAAIVFSL